MAPLALIFGLACAVQLLQQKLIGMRLEYIAFGI